MIILKTKLNHLYAPEMQWKDKSYAVSLKNVKQEMKNINAEIQISLA